MRARRRIHPALVVLFAIVLALSNLGVACGRPSAADRDPIVKDGKRVPGNVQEEFPDLPSGGRQPAEMGPAGGGKPQSVDALPKVLVAGDSVAFFLSLPIVTKQKAYGIEAHTQANQVCGLVRVEKVRHQAGQVDETGTTCRWPDAWAPKELATFRPDIVLVAMGAPPIVDYEVDGAWVAPCDAAFDAWYTRHFAEVVDLLSSTGAFVVVANTAYPSTFPVIPQGVERTDCLNLDMEAAIVGKRAAIADLNGWVCPGGRCDNTRGGVVLRPDGIHYTKEGADLVADWLVPETLRLAGR